MGVGTGTTSGEGLLVARRTGKGADMEQGRAPESPSKGSASAGAEAAPAAKAAGEAGKADMHPEPPGESSIPSPGAEGAPAAGAATGVGGEGDDERGKPAAEAGKAPEAGAPGGTGKAGRSGESGTPSRAEAPAAGEEESKACGGGASGEQGRQVEVCAPEEPWATGGCQAGNSDTSCGRYGRPSYTAGLKRSSPFAFWHLSQ